MDLRQLLQIVVLGLLQGFAELFPVSSLGHSVVLPSLLGWQDLTGKDYFLPILTVLHLGTTIALLTFYWRDWIALIRAFFKTLVVGRLDADPQGKTIWLIIVGSIPIGITGLLLEKPLQAVFFPLCLAGTPSRVSLHEWRHAIFGRGAASARGGNAPEAHQAQAGV